VRAQTIQENGDNELSHYTNKKQVMEQAAAAAVADNLNKRQSRHHSKTGGLGFYCIVRLGHRYLKYSAKLLHTYS
jgi:hypothetical protein